MTEALSPIALTVGEPAGIGPDIVLSLLQDPPSTPLLIFGDPKVLIARANQRGLSPDLLTQHHHIDIASIPQPSPVIAGQLNVNNANSVVHSIHAANHACIDNNCRALVTGPVHKGIINDAGIPFTGHTELLAQLNNIAQTVMMLASSQLKVALATTHLPLSAVPKAITRPSLQRCLEILHHDLENHFHISQPQIAVCGLNPHAGESGHLGQEEIDTIIPVLDHLRATGMQLLGPLPADTAFTPYTLNHVDVVLAMYHDQGLPVIKSQAFHQAVNITLGLPIIRTSVDHGVALSLAGHGQVSASSLRAALQCADRLSLTRSKSNSLETEIN